MAVALIHAPAHGLVRDALAKIHNVKERNWIAFYRIASREETLAFADPYASPCASRENSLLAISLCGVFASGWN